MVEVNVDGVLEVANERYPALAEIYNGIVGDLEKHNDAMSTPNQHELSNTLEDYMNTVTQMLRISSKHMHLCGDTLKWISDCLVDVDEENARCIDPPPEGLPAETGSRAHSECHHGGTSP